MRGNTHAHNRTTALVGLTIVLPLLGSGIVSPAAVAEPTGPYVVSHGAGASTAPDLTPDGRSVAYVSATALAPADKNSATDVYVGKAPFDGTPVLASVAADDGAANGPSSQPAISGDGHFVAFTSSATNLVAGDTNSAPDVFVRDLFTGGTTRVQGTAQPACAAGPEVSGSPAVSADGRKVAFVSTADNLTRDDTDCTSDVFLADRDTGAITLVSTGPDAASEPAISGNGRFVSFTTTTGQGTRAWRWSAAGGPTPVGSVDAADRAGQTSLSDDGVVAYVSGETSHQGVSLPAGPKVLVEWPGGYWEWVSDGLGGATPSDPAVSGDGASVAFVAGGQVHVAATETRYGTGGPGYDGTPAPVVGPANGAEPVITAGGHAVALSTTTPLTGDTDADPDVAVYGVTTSDQVLHPRLDTLDGIAMPAPLQYVDTGNIPTDYLSGTSGTQGANRGIINRGIINRGIINRGIINRGIINRGIIGDIPLSELPLLTPEGGFVSLLAGTPFADVPLQALTFGEVMTWAAAHPDDPAAQGLLGLGLTDFAQGSAIGDISTGSILLLAAPLADVPLRRAGSDGNLDAWQDAVAAQGFPRSLVDGSTVLIDLEAAGVDLDALGIGQILVKDVPVASSGLPYLQVDQLNLDSPLGHVGIDELSSPGSVCGACSTGTLQSNSGAIGDGVTMADLGPQLPVRITLEELARAMTLPEALQWENVQWNAIGPGRFAIPKDSPAEGPGFQLGLSYRAAFDTGTGGAAYVRDAVLDVELPHGTAFHDASFGATGPREFEAPYKFQPDGTGTGYEDLGSHVLFHLGDVPSGTTLDVDVQVTDTVDYDQTAPLDAVLRSSTGADHAKITLHEPAGYQQLQDPPGGNAPGTAPTLGRANRIYFGGLTRADDVDYYKIPRAPYGKRLVVELGSVGGDTDLGAFRATTDDPAPPSGTPDTAYLGSAPLLDQGRRKRQQPAPGNILQEPGYTLLDGSTHTGTDPEEVEVPGTIGGTGTVLVRVSSAGRTSSLPYTLRWLYVDEPTEQKCPPVTFPFPDTTTGGSLPPSLPTGTNTVFLVDARRMSQTFGDLDTNSVLNNIGGLHGKYGIKSQVIPITGADSGDKHKTSAVVAARARFDQDPCSVSAANALARAIAAQLQTYLVGDAAQTVKYVVLVGGDDIFPFFRDPQATTDVLESWNESSLRLRAPRPAACATGLGAPWDALPCDRYATPVSAAAHSNTILTDDPYVDPKPTKVLDRYLSVPDYSIARLGETPAVINRAIETFLDSGGVMNADTLLASGYQAWNELPDRVARELGGRVTGRTSLLTGGWSRAQLLDRLFPGGWTPNLGSINAHASETDLLPGVAGDGSDRFTTSDLITAQDLDQRVKAREKATNDAKGKWQAVLLWSIGCHAGGPRPDLWYGADGLDLAQVLGASGGYVANTGYGIADTAATGLSEQLSALYARALTSGLTAGQALVKAKHDYLAGLGQYLGYDEKVLMQTTYYGLPMYQVKGISGAQPTPPVQRTTSWTAPATDPRTGLTVRTTSVDPTFETRTAPDGSQYLTSGEDPAVLPGLPLLSKMTFAIADVSGQAPHGALITGATSTTDGPTDLAVADSDFGDGTGPGRYDDLAVPESLAQVTGEKSLVLMTDRVDGDSTGTGTAGRTERMTHLDVTTYFSGTPDAGPPIVRTTSTTSGASRTFTVVATDDAGPGTTKRAVLLVQPRGSTTWAPVEMTRASGDTWQATITDPVSFRAFAQVVDSHGYVGVDANRGHFLRGSSQAPSFSLPGTIDIDQGQRWLDEIRITDPDSTRFYGYVDYGYGDEAIQVDTAADGTPLALLEILGHSPGQLPTTVTICDDSGNCTSIDVVVNVAPANTAPESSVTLSPTSPGPDDVLTASATGTDADGDPVTLSYRWWVDDELVQEGGTTFDLSRPGHGDYGDTVTVTVTPNDGTVDGGGSSASVTLRQPTVPTVDAGPDATVDEGVAFRRTGSYTAPDGDVVTATVDYGDGAGPQPLALAGGSFTLDHTYADNGGRTVTVTVTDADGAVVTDTVAVTVANVAPTFVGDASPDPVDLGQPSKVTVRFKDVAADTHTARIDWGDGTTSPMTVDQAADTATATHTYGQSKAYPLTATVTDDDGGTTTALVGYASVYKNTNGFVAGAGSFTSPAGAWSSYPDATGTALFGLVAANGGLLLPPTGSLRLQYDATPADGTCSGASCLDFSSTSFASYSISGSVARMTGSGTLNGAVYSFLVSVKDGNPDTVRIKLWQSGRTPVFDTMRGAADTATPVTPLTGGSIVLGL
ncbi:MAG TPA: PKD domain-containing protein [Nocardioides sp.]|nr:PKD domain-containing protein [Nocardioides sp.]